MKEAGAERLPLVMLSSGGNARVLSTLALAAGHNLIGVGDPQLAAQGALHLRRLAGPGDDETIGRFDPFAVGLTNGIGQLVSGGACQDVSRECGLAATAFPRWCIRQHGLRRALRSSRAYESGPPTCPGQTNLASVRHSHLRTELNL